MLFKILGCLEICLVAIIGSARSFILIAVPAENRLSAIWFKRQFSNFSAAFRTFPITLIHLSLRPTAASILSHILMTVAAVNRPVAAWHEWQFGNCRSATGTFPLTLVHWSLPKALLVVHVKNFLYFVTLNPANLLLK